MEISFLLLQLKGVLGPADDKEVLNELYSYIPLYRTMPTGFGYDVFLILDTVEISQTAPNIWRVEITYSLPDDSKGASNTKSNIGPHTNDYQSWSNNYVQVTVNSIATTKRITTSLRTVACQKRLQANNQNVPFPQGRPAPIGWTIDGIEGVEVLERNFEFTLTVYKSPADYSFAYIRKLYRMSKTVNNDTFFGFPEGSVLFVGHDASSESMGNVVLNFTFRMQPNFKFSRTQQTTLMPPTEDDPNKMFDVYYEPDFPDAGGQMPGGAFSGWSVVDYLYTPLPEGASGMTIQRPYMRVVHEVYGYSDFDLLEI
ncbi:MAG: hypothetical protein KatS3mg087_1364 [Patescibacteria group bacterium]|nr:MAG: hypothetical protein KatS3mg087_1364 [Patescibacteria group bacterium]